VAGFTLSFDQVKTMPVIALPLSAKFVGAGGGERYVPGTVYVAGADHGLSCPRRLALTYQVAVDPGFSEIGGVVHVPPQ
jgi:hypothetical protein